MNSRFKWPLRLLITLAILYIGICFFMKWAQKSFLFHPEVVGQNHAWPKDGDPEEVFLATADGARINGLYYKADSAIGAVLFLHGNGGNIGHSSAARDRFLPHHHDVFFIDYRGYGKSTGELYEQGLYHDAEAAYEYLRSRHPEQKITVYGESLGSGIATHLAATYQPRMLILETPYTAIVDVAKGNYPWLPVSWLLDFPLQSKPKLQKAQCPVLIFHGTADEVIPHAQGQEMAKAAARATFISLPGVAHNQCAGTARYQEEVAKALQIP